MSRADERATGVHDANPWLVVTLRGAVYAVSIDVENGIDASRHGISPTRLESAPRVARNAVEALLRGGARFATLRGPDRRPHPDCARGLLARIDARVRAAGMRALVGPWNEADGPLDEALRCADALLARGDAELEVRLRLCEDVSDVLRATTMPTAASAEFAEALRIQRSTLEALCGAAFALTHERDGTLRVRVTQPRVGPHLVLATLLAAGASAGGAPVVARSAAVPPLAALLGDDVAARVAEPR